MNANQARPGAPLDGTPGLPLFYRNHSSFGRIEENVACDEALLDQAEEEGIGPVLRFWEMSSLAVVLGASSRLDSEVRLEACHRDGVAITRRTSGGGTVLVGPGVLCVALVLPITAKSELAAVDTAQRYILERSATALSLPGRTIEVQGLGDLTLDGQKVSGSAQRRLRRNVLVHFTLLYDMDPLLIEGYLGQPGRVPAYRAGRKHSDFVANLPLNKADLEARLAREWATGCLIREIGDPMARIERILADKMDRVGWVERFR